MNANRKFVYDRELKLKAKKANQRMRELEKIGAKSPAYQAVQARLSAMGVKPTKEGVYRFPETGKAADQKAVWALHREVNKFNYQQTSTLSGYKAYRKKIWESAKSHYQGIEERLTEDEYFEIWESLPTDKKDRIFGSEQYITLVETFIYRRDKSRGSDMSIEEIIKKMQTSETLKEAYDRLGLNYKATGKTRKRHRGEIK